MSDFLINLPFILSSFEIVKLAVLIGIGLYAVFAFVVLNQVQTMNNLVKTSSGSVLIFILALLHLFFTVSLFAFALAIL